MIPVQANELRIGNYVQFQTSTVYQVDMLYKDYEMLKHWHSILITEEWLLHFGFELWKSSEHYSNERESYKRYVAYNVIGGTSNFEVHIVTSTYGNKEHTQLIVSIDEDERINNSVELEFIHQLQNFYFVLTGYEISIEL